MSIYWYEKAAEQGHDMAQYKLGMKYNYGIGVDFEKAYYWLNKASLSGNIFAKEELSKVIRKDDNEKT